MAALSNVFQNEEAQQNEQRILTSIFNFDRIGESQMTKAM